MPKDKEERSAETREDDQQVGATEGRKGQSVIDGKGRYDENAPATAENVAITLVDEMIEAKRTETRDVVERFEPTTRLTSAAGETVTSVDSLQSLKIKQRIETTVEPRQVLTQDAEALRITTAVGVQPEKTTQSIFQSVHPHRELEENEEITVVTMREISAEKSSQTVNQSMTAQQPRQGTDQLKLEDEDPVFRWKGGTPYGSANPKLVIHRMKEGIPSLPFLKRLLRDTYKELEGGEPGADSVEFVTNEPRIPQLQKNIVTLEITDDGWTPSMRNDRPVIERNGVDIVPKLREAASTLYTGELGYLVVSIPTDWEGDIRRPGFFDELMSRIAGSEPGDETEEVVFERVQSTPVVLAEPSISDGPELFRKVASYYALSHDVETFEAVQQIEEVQERTLRRNDWKRIALTERQHSAEESDEHYFWKAAIAEGLAREMKRCHDEGLSPEERGSFAGFLKEKVLAENIVQSEYQIEGRDDNDVIADLHIDSPHGWQQDGVTSFLNQADKVTNDVIIEFETGRSEGAFNFRKIRETLEKYTEARVSGKFIAVVVPPRLLFRGERRANMIEELVESWNEVEAGNTLEAGLFVPVMGNLYCEKLEPASSTKADMYGDTDD